MAEDKTIQIQYYALLRDEAGLAHEAVKTTASTASDLYAELKVRHGFSLAAKQLKVAINDQFADWNATINPSDVVVFIPPVAGG